MVRENEIRKAEITVEMHAARDGCRAGVHWSHPHAVFLAHGNAKAGSGRWATLRIEVFEPWVVALDSFTQFERIEVIYWLHLSRRDLVMQSPANDGTSRGTFSLRSPARPNPIGTSIAKLVSIDGAIVMVRGLNCVDGTPLLDLKPDRACSRRSRRLNRVISR